METARVPSVRRSRKGQGLVEFVLVLPVLLILIFGITEFSLFFFTRLTLRHSVLEATRFAVTGNALEGDDSGDPLSRAESIRLLILSRADPINVDVDRIEILPPDGGGPGQVVRISVTYEYLFRLPFIHRLFPGGRANFRVSTAMQNEPFFP